MNKEEILAMEAGNELDILVAKKVMNRKFPTVEEMKEIAYEQWKDQPSCIHFFRGFDAWEHQDGTFCWKYNADAYSTDISAAWEVVEKFYYSDIRKLNGCNWGAWVGRGDGHSSNVTSVTAPEAICKAALICCLEGN